MNNIASIRKRLEMTQAEIAAGMGCTQANVSFYERGQTVPPDAARRLIEFVKGKGIELTFNDVYAEPEAKAEA